MTAPSEFEDEDHTRVVERVAAVEADDEDHTRVVERVAAVEADDEDHTRLVSRAGTPGDDDEDHTRLVSRAGTPGDDAEDRTRVVGREAKAAPLQAATASAPAAQAAAAHVLKPEGRRRRGITPPPVPHGFAPQAVEASGPGAISTYEARPITQAPELTAVITEGATASRTPDPTMRSVARASHRQARAALVAFVIACVASAGGLGWIAWLLIAS